MSLAQDILDARHSGVWDGQVREDALGGVDALLFQLQLLELPDAEDQALLASLERWRDAGDHYRACLPEAAE